MTGVLWIVCAEISTTEPRKYICLGHCVCECKYVWIHMDTGAFTCSI